MMMMAIIANTKVLELTPTAPSQVAVASNSPSGLKHTLFVMVVDHLSDRTLCNNDSVRARGPIGQRALGEERTKFGLQFSHHRSGLSQSLLWPNTYRSQKIEHTKRD